jgi:hypothetical protein
VSTIPTRKQQNTELLDNCIDFGKQLFAGILRSRKGALSELSRILRFQPGTKGFEREYQKLLPMEKELETAFFHEVTTQLPDEGLRIGIFDDSSIKKSGKLFPKQQYHRDNATKSFYSGMKVFSSAVSQKGKVAVITSKLVGKEDNKLLVAKEEATRLIMGFLVDIVLFDCWYCQPILLNHLREYNQLFVSRTKCNSKICIGEKQVRIDTYANGLPHTEFELISIHGKSYWVKDLVLNFKAFGELRVIISKDGVHNDPIFIVTNATQFSAQFVVKLYLKRFAIEVFFKDAKQFLNFETFCCRSPAKWDLHLLLTNILHWAIQKRNSISKTVLAIREDIEQCLLFINRLKTLSGLFQRLRRMAQVSKKCG